MKNLRLLFVICIVLCSTITYSQSTTDVEGSKDYPSISRINGAIIQFYKETVWGTYKIPINDLQQLDWKHIHEVSGKVTRIQYTVDKQITAEIALNKYKSSLLSLDYELLLGICNEELGDSNRPHTWHEKFYVDGGYYNGFGNEKFGQGLEFPIWQKNHSFLVLKGLNSDKNTYVVVYTVVAENYTLITMDVIELENVPLDILSVEKITADIKCKGAFAIYDINFDEGKATITSNSTEALQIIADYINANPDLKFYIVDHTGNNGNTATNITLSQARAKSVMSTLIARYDVNSSQLKAYGVGPLCPKAPNTTPKGQAENSRVVIVMQ